LLAANATTKRQLFARDASRDATLEANNGEANEATAKADAETVTF